MIGVFLTGQGEKIILLSLYLFLLITIFKNGERGEAACPYAHQEIGQQRVPHLYEIFSQIGTFCCQNREVPGTASAILPGCSSLSFERQGSRLLINQTAWRVQQVGEWHIHFAFAQQSLGS